MSRIFTIDDVLSVVPGCLVSDRHMGGVYDILGYMTNDTLFTHQLPRAARECSPYLVRQFPQLEGPLMDAAVADLKIMLAGDKDAACKTWVANIVNGKYGFSLPAEVSIERIPRDDHDQKDPMDEAVEMFGADKVIKIDLESGQ